jgi:quercetin dioxygenase-like cupin family protein
MKILVYLAGFAIIVVTLMAQETKTNSPAPAAPAKLSSTVFDWEKMSVTPTANGARRAVFDAPTTTLDKVHCHITTLNPGQNSGEPRRHLQEEIIIVKEGLVEATFDGKTQTAGPGSVFFFAANAVTRLRNAGDGPATYIVVYYHTPLTPKD